MKNWQYNVIFWLAVLGTALLFIAPAVPGLKDIGKNPLSYTAIGTIMAYVLSQKSKGNDNGKKEE